MKGAPSPGGQALGEAEGFVSGGDLGGVDELRGLSLQSDRGGGDGTAGGLPMSQGANQPKGIQALATYPQMRAEQSADTSNAAMILVNRQIGKGRRT
jgi:hypothetical protein